MSTSTRICLYIRHNVLGLVAIFIALGGTAIALPGRNTVNSGDIINGQVKSRDIGSGHVRTSDIGADAVSSAKVAPGAITPVSQAQVPAARLEGTSGAVTSNFQNATWSTEVYDTAGLFTPAQPERLTAPIDGIYATSATLCYNAGTPTGQRVLEIVRTNPTDAARNGFVASNQTDVNSAPAGGYFTCLPAATHLDLRAGESLRVQAGTLNQTGPVSLTNTGHVSAFELTWVAPPPVTE